MATVKSAISFAEQKRAPPSRPPYSIRSYLRHRRSQFGWIRLNNATPQIWLRMTYSSFYFQTRKCDAQSKIFSWMRRFSPSRKPTLQTSRKRLFTYKSKCLRRLRKCSKYCIQIYHMFGELTLAVRPHVPLMQMQWRCMRRVGQVEPRIRWKYQIDTVLSRYIWVAVKPKRKVIALLRA